MERSARAKRPHRKRAYVPPNDAVPPHRNLRSISELISRREYAPALADINQRLATATVNSLDQSRLLSLVGDVEFARGRYEEAARTYLHAARHSMPHHEEWIRPLMGHIKSLLKGSCIADARMMAEHMMDVAESKMAEFDALVRGANGAFRESGDVDVAPLPVRPSVVATRLGRTFLREGENDLAAMCFQRAITGTPRGASGARLGMACVAVAANRPGEALAWAEQAIRRGRFQAKTIPAWEVLICARHRLGGWKIKDSLIRGLQAATPSVRARAVLCITTIMHRLDMDQWRSIADDWLAREGRAFPVVEVEIRKLMLAGLKQEPGCEKTAHAAAGKLMTASPLAPIEWLSAAKEFLRTAGKLSRPGNIADLVKQAERRFGEAFAARAAYGFALSESKAGRYESARRWLTFAANHPAGSDSIKLRSFWMLGDVAEKASQPGAAAEWYERYIHASPSPNAFVLQARLRRAQALAAVGRHDALLAERQAITRQLRDSGEYELILNFARQLAASAPELEQWSIELYELGEQQARHAFRHAATPADAIDVLFKWARRQVIDFGRADEALAFWEELSLDRKMWLWSREKAYWRYMGILMIAHMRIASDRLEWFARQLIDDPATPEEGLAQIGSPYGEWLMRGERADEAWQVFRRVIEGAPTSEASATSWYWMGLRALRQENQAEMKRCMISLRRAQGVDPDLQGMWELDARARLCLAGLDIAAVMRDTTRYAEAKLKRQRDRIIHDMGRITP